MIQRFYNLALVLGLIAVAACNAGRGPSVGDDTLTGKVSVVFDGDSMIVVVDGKEESVRLEGIDSPEKDQPYGAQAKQALSDMVFGRTVTVRVVGEDKYGRILGFMTVDGQNVNLWMVAGGHAWHYKHFNNDADLAAAEEEARISRLGLWAAPNPIQPYQWRRSRRKTAASSVVP